jgi:hypothetical protein
LNAKHIFFKSGLTRALVSTDIAARGIDIEDFNTIKKAATEINRMPLFYAFKRTNV